MPAFPCPRVAAAAISTLGGAREHRGRILLDRRPMFPHRARVVIQETVMSRSASTACSNSPSSSRARGETDLTWRPVNGISITIRTGRARKAMASASAGALGPVHIDISRRSSCSIPTARLWWRRPVWHILSTSPRLTRTIGIAPSANIIPEANPLGVRARARLAPTSRPGHRQSVARSGRGAMMLEYLGETDAAQAIVTRSRRCCRRQAAHADCRDQPTR